jgi:hypothetical protein
VVVPILLVAFSTIAARSLHAQGESQYLALITDLSGKVVVKKAQKTGFEKAVWGMQLFQGDQLKTYEGSEVTLLFSNKNLIALGANSSLTISDGSLSPKTPKPIRSVDADLLADVSVLSLRRTSEGEMGALAGLRSGATEEAIVLLSPRNSKIKSVRPSFIWDSKKEFDSFKVTLYDSDGPVWARDVSGRRLDYPEDATALEHGQSYFWHVEGEGLFDTYKSPSLGFTVLSRDELDQVESEERKVEGIFREGTSGSSVDLILGAYYDKVGLYGDAIDRFENIAKMNSDAPLPHEILGKLYQNIGLKDKAIVQLQKAIELSQ